MLGQELWGRPAFPAFIGLCSGLGLTVSPWLALLPFVLALAGGWKALAWSLPFALVGIFMRPMGMTPALLEPFPASVVVTVAQPPRAMDFGVSFVGDSDLGRLAVFVPGKLDLAIGDEVEVSGLLRSSDEIWARNGIKASLSAKKAFVKSRDFALWRLGSHARNSFRTFVKRHSQPHSAALLVALCFGDTSDLDDRDQELIRRSGASHLVAASGLNVLILSAALLAALSWIPIPRAIQLGILMAMLICYGGAAGLETPIVRAILMTAIFLGAELVRREPDALSAASLAGIATLLWEPRDILSASFWLTYGAVLALILYGSVDWRPALRALGKNPVLDGILPIISTTTIATLGAAPVVAMVFGELPWLGLLTNLAVIPVTGLVTVGSLVLWLASFVAPGVAGAALSVVIQPYTGYMLAVFEAVGSLDWGVANLPAVPLWWVLLYGACGILMHRRSRVEADR